MASTERSPKLFDYFAGAILTNGLGTMAIYLAAYEPFFQYLLLPLLCLAAAVSTYLVCMRTSKNHLLTGVKTAVTSIVLGVVMMPAMQGFEIGPIVTILVCYLIGSIIGAYYALREQLKKKTLVRASSAIVEP